MYVMQEQQKLINKIIAVLIDSDIKLAKDFVSIYEWIDKHWCKKEFIFYETCDGTHGKHFLKFNGDF